MINHRQIDFVLQSLTRNLLSASEFQDHFSRLNHQERMLLLERLDATVHGAPPPASPPALTPRTSSR
ncbi:MAG TPA: hypothetical protein VM120_08205 [Bryobacteraceae bacterium]|nr:hypothetical protein [Bryobacteraceae bacterium]